MCLLIKKYSLVKRRAHPHTRTHKSSHPIPTRPRRAQRAAAGARPGDADRGRYAHPATATAGHHATPEATRDPRAAPRRGRDGRSGLCPPHTAAERARALSERGTGELKRDSIA